MRASLLLLLAGCSKPYGDLPKLSFEEVPYDNPLMTADDAVITAFDTQLACPDGTNARLFALYRSESTEMSPVAIVLHSGAFDYTTPEGIDYHSDSRLNRSWAISKVWETLGMNPDSVDPFEDHQGALTAALTDAGVIQLYPGNCWGDLWHNEQGYQDNDAATEGFSRNGRTFAYWMIRLLVETSFAAGQEFELPVNWNTSEVYLIGLGDGGRGVAEVLGHDNLTPIQGVLVDSSPDQLGPYFDDPITYSEEIAGMNLIFGKKDIEHIDDWSLAALQADELLPERVGFLWSDGDPRQPVETMSATAASLSENSAFWVENLHSTSHVHLGSDLELANEAVSYLMTGNVPASD